MVHSVCNSTRAVAALAGKIYVVGGVSFEPAAIANDLMGEVSWYSNVDFLFYEVTRAANYRSIHDDA